MVFDIDEICLLRSQLYGFDLLRYGDLLKCRGGNVSNSMLFLSEIVMPSS